VVRVGPDQAAAASEGGLPCREQPAGTEPSAMRDAPVVRCRSSVAGDRPVSGTFTRRRTGSYRSVGATER
jgi:hypothetical protein